MDRSWVHARKRDYEGIECGEQGGIHRGRGELDGTKWYRENICFLCSFFLVSSLYFVGAVCNWIWGLASRVISIISCEIPDSIIYTVFS